jgi:hypothetical protein
MIKSEVFQSQKNNHIRHDAYFLVNKKIAYNLAEQMSMSGCTVYIYNPFSGAEHIYKNGIMYSLLDETEDNRQNQKLETKSIYVSISKPFTWHEFSERKLSMSFTSLKPI